MPEYNPEPPKLELELLSLEGDYLIFTLKSFGANVKRKNDKTERTVWATYDTPEGKITKVAWPLHPGAGPQPDNSITVSNVRDMVHEALRTLEGALDDINNSTKGDSW